MVGLSECLDACFLLVCDFPEAISGGYGIDFLRCGLFLRRRFDFQFEEAAFGFFEFKVVGNIFCGLFVENGGGFLPHFVAAWAVEKAAEKRGCCFIAEKLAEVDDLFVL